MLAVNAILSWEEVRDTFNIGDSQKTMVEGFINAASQAMEEEAHGYIKARARSFVLDAPGGYELRVPDYPVVSGLQVWYDPSRVFGPDTLLSDTVLYAENGLLWRQAGWPAGRQVVKIEATIGLDPIPEDIRDACFRLVKKAVRDYTGDKMGIKSVSGPDGQNVTFEYGLPYEVREILGRYRRVAT